MIVQICVFLMYIMCTHAFNRIEDQDVAYPSRRGSSNACIRPRVCCRRALQGMWGPECAAMNEGAYRR